MKGGRWVTLATPSCSRVGPSPIASGHTGQIGQMGSASSLGLWEPLQRPFSRESTMAPITPDGGSQWPQGLAWSRDNRPEKPSSFQEQSPAQGWQAPSHLAALPWPPVKAGVGPGPKVGREDMKGIGM